MSSQTPTAPEDTPPQAPLEAFRLVSAARAMGLVARSVRRTVDLIEFQAAIDAFKQVGIGAGFESDAARRPISEAYLKILLSVIEDSPLPSYEWTSMTELLGEEMLAGLVRVSQSSIHRYRAGQRVTPDQVAARLHFLALVASDLAGSYNEIGVRRWFQRSRSALGGRSPAGMLSRNDWDPDDEESQQVRVLAAALLTLSGA